ncbi:MAG: hypothetical protein ACE5HX_00845, partial [bacterium]
MRKFLFLIFLFGCSPALNSQTQDLFVYNFKVDNAPAWEWWEQLRKWAPQEPELWFIISDDSMNIKTAMTIPVRKEWDKSRYVDIITLSDSIPNFGFQLSYAVD